MSSDVQERLERAREWAWQAGRITLQHFQADVVVERKSDNSPVTIADRAAEQHLRSAIATSFPDDAILGEEFGEQQGSSGYRWILDPIDGTKSFISGVPLYGTLIGVESANESVIGVILIPALGEMVFASKGGGAFYQREGGPPEPTSVSETPLAEGLFVATQVDSFMDRQAHEVFLGLQAEASITRTWGDCYGYFLVATGRAVVMIDPILNLWDAAAIQPVLEEAGGCFVDWGGNRTIYAGEAIGCNRRAMDDVLRHTQPFAGQSGRDGSLG